MWPFGCRCLGAVMGLFSVSLDPGPLPSLTLQVPLSLTDSCGPLVIPASAVPALPRQLPPAPCARSELTHQFCGPALSCSWWEADAVSALLFWGPALLATSTPSGTGRPKGSRVCACALMSVCVCAFPILGLKTKIFESHGPVLVYLPNQLTQRSPSHQHLHTARQHSSAEGSAEQGVANVFQELKRFLCAFELTATRRPLGGVSTRIILIGG